MHSFKKVGNDFGILLVCLPLYDSLENVKLLVP
uniref:Uncharacterized protein n=1 Tax=Anguilla anguilla TaxID=7936 RepID=A0A0E9T064_ANGAN